MNTKTSNDAGSTDEMVDRAKEAADSVKEDAHEVLDRAEYLGETHAREKLSLGKEKVTDQLETISSALDSAGHSLENQDHPLTDYVNDLSSQLSKLSEKVSTSSLDELANDARRVARDNPALFVMGTVAAGLIASRFFKATDGQSDPSHRFHDEDRSGRTDSGTGDNARRERLPESLDSANPYPDTMARDASDQSRTNAPQSQRAYPAEQEV